MITQYISQRKVCKHWIGIILCIHKSKEKIPCTNAQASEPKRHFKKRKIEKKLRKNFSAWLKKKNNEIQRLNL